MVYILDNKVLVTCHIFYYMPDHQNLIQEFIFQDFDLKPQYPRVNKFLDFWRREIDAVIKDILIADANNTKFDRFNKIDQIFQIH